MKQALLIIFSLLLFAFATRAQTLSDKDLAYFKKFEDSLVPLQKSIYAAKTDSAKFKNNAKFRHLLEEVLLNTLSFTYPFDSLKEIKRLTSPDKKFRFIGWDLPKADGTYMYFGFIQALHPKTKKYEVYELTDKSAAAKSPETYVGDNTKWFGMLYYTIIPCDNYYVLLGWDGNDKLSSRKFIDVLSFKKDGTPLFGKPVFNIPKKSPNRIMFEFNAKLTMTLRYNPTSQSIVFDHLAPKEDFLDKQYQFYGPDLSYDAFNYRRGKWNFEEEVDVQNPRNKLDNIHHDKNKKEKPVYTPK
ncbi:MAG TPA: hypothetical protein VN698_00170 [Bacteroidia bacterium]|nr:hypothetical protein [Bacteroidia bacterium]